MKYLQNCPAGGQERQKTLKNVSNFEWKKKKHEDESHREPNKQEQFEQSEHKLKICAEFLSTHRYNLQLKIHRLVKASKM